MGDLRDKAAEVRCDLDRIEKTILREAGWRYTCQTPGSYWMWEKKIDDRVVLVDQCTALRIVEETPECSCPIQAEPDDNRAHFQVRIAEQIGLMDFGRDEYGEYVNKPTAWAWEGWLAAHDVAGPLMEGV